MQEATIMELEKRSKLWLLVLVLGAQIQHAKLLSLKLIAWWRKRELMLLLLLLLVQQSLQLFL
jgi:hypothetical protein